MTERHEHGVALVIVLMTMTLLAALGAAITLATITETAIAANYRDAAETLYAAEAMVEFAMQEITDIPDWTEVIAQPGRSAFVDGPAGGVRTVGTVTLDLTLATQDINTFAAGASGTSSSPAVLYAFGRFQDLLPSGVGGSRTYVAVWIADRSHASGQQAVAPEALSILGQAYGPLGSRRAVEAIVEKAGAQTIRAVSWRELR